MVVFPDADLEKVIPGVTRGAFFLNGQNCMAGTRLFVHKDIFDTVVERVAGMAGQFRIGHGLSPDSDLGPLISAEQREARHGLRQCRQEIRRRTGLWR
jgi:phenylacetaldehyde dehydrogenase